MAPWDKVKWKFRENVRLRPSPKGAPKHISQLMLRSIIRSLAENIYTGDPTAVKYYLKG